MADRKRLDRRGRQVRAHNDSIDLAELFFVAPARKDGPDRKTLQLCRQALRALSLAIGECGDPLLQTLIVQDVTPAPNASCLMVSIAYGATTSRIPLPELLERLDRANAFLRARVVETIVRRKAPQLLFRVVSLPEVQP